MALSHGAAAEWRRFWFVPFAAAFGYATSVIHVYGIGPFIEPLQESFGWSRAQTSSGITIAAFLSSLFCIPVGMLVDRIGPRRVGLIGVLLMAGSFALLSLTNGEQSNWIALWVLVAVGTLWVQATIWTSAVASRFEVSRGLAFAVTLSGASIAAALFPILGTWLIGNYGWRTAFVAMGGLWATLVFPLLLLFFRGAQDSAPQQRAAAKAAAAQLPGLSIAEGIRSPALYKLLLAAALFAFTAIGAVVHFVPILTDSGASRVTAASIASLIGIFSIVGRLGTGLLLDRFPGHLVGAIACVAPVFGALLLLIDGSNPAYQMVAAALIGFTVGAEVDVVAYLATKHFGLRNFGALYGALSMALGLGTAFGPLAAGALFDNFGSYAIFLKLVMVLMSVAALALATLGAPPRLAPLPQPATS